LVNQSKPEKAATICCLFECSPEARPLLHDDPAPPTYLARLIDHGLYKDAIRFVAHLLPARAAVWWGLLCVWQVERPTSNGVEANAIKAALRWVQEPSEENRRMAYEPGKAATGLPAGGVAMAAFWSGGSMAPPGKPEVAPPPELCGKTVAAAVLAASSKGAPADRDQRCRQFLVWANGVICGQIPWE
jgi:hypothetical protein